MKNKRALALLIFPILLFASLTACARMGNDSADQGAQMQEDIAREQDMAGDGMAGSAPDHATDSDEGGLDLGEKIIENASLDFETTEFEDTTAFINNKIEEYGGSLEHSSRGQSSSSYGFIGEYISMTIRLPHDQLRPFIDELNAHDELFIQHQEISRADVTRAFRDNETRIAILREEEMALREMLQEQGSLEEVLQIRTRLYQVISEREIYEDANRTYNEQAEFSTVYLHVQQTDRADTRNVGGFWNRLADAFVDSFYRFIAVSQSLVITFVYAIPYLIILAIVGFVVWRVFRRVRKKD